MTISNGRSGRSGMMNPGISGMDPDIGGMSHLGEELGGVEFEHPKAQAKGEDETPRQQPTADVGHVPEGQEEAPPAKKSPFRVIPGGKSAPEAENADRDQSIVNSTDKPDSTASEAV